MLLKSPRALTSMFLRDLGRCFVTPTDYFEPAPELGPLTAVDAFFWRPVQRASLFAAENEAHGRPADLLLALVSYTALTFGLLWLARKGRLFPATLDRRGAVLCVLFGTWCVTGMFLVWLGDGMDLERHVLPFSAPLRMAALLAAGWCTREPSGPDAANRR